MPWAGGHYALAYWLIHATSHPMEGGDGTVQDHHEGPGQHQFRHRIPRPPVPLFELLLLLYMLYHRLCESWLVSLLDQSLTISTRVVVIGRTKWICTPYVVVYCHRFRPPSVEPENLVFARFRLRLGACYDKRCTMFLPPGPKTFSFEGN